MLSETDHPHAFSAEQIRQFSRQIILPEVGAEGQKKIFASRVLLVGVGGLGCATGIYLAASGIGNLGLIDADRVHSSNLHRQILYSKSDEGKPKVFAAEERLSKINDHTRFQTYFESLNEKNAAEIFANYDLILDGSDNFATKFLVNDICLKLSKPAILAAIFKFSGQMITVLPGKTACFRCVFSEAPNQELLPGCAETGVLGSVVGTLGSMQATGALQWITDSPAMQPGRFLLFDLWNMRLQNNKIHPRKDCACSGENSKIL